VKRRVTKMKAFVIGEESAVGLYSSSTYISWYKGPFSGTVGDFLFNRSKTSDSWHGGNKR
jgi:hypothetical protein